MRVADIVRITLYDPDSRALDQCESNWNETADDIYELLILCGMYPSLDREQRVHIAHTADQQLRDNIDAGEAHVELPDWYWLHCSVQSD